MPRHPILNDRQIFTAVGAALAGDGAVTLQTIVSQTGASIGSLYHRFASREGLMAETWLDAAEAFQKRFTATLAKGGAGERGLAAGETAALVTPRFSRDDRARAVVLACCRPEEFISTKTAPDLKSRVNAANKAAGTAVRAFATQTGVSADALWMGLVAFPMGAVRLYLPHSPVPKSVDGYVAAAYWAAVKTP